MIDGVIKYGVTHISDKAPQFKGYTKLEALRLRLFRLGLIGVQDGIGYGNISLRENSSSFFITATQTGELEHLSQEFYTYIDSYNFEKFSVTSMGKHKPSSEALSHAMIYEISPEIDAVIHIHSKALWKFMKEQNSLFTEAEYGTIAMVEEIASLYEGKNPFQESAFVMRGHEDGVMAFGKTLQEAELILFDIMQKYLTRKI
jgi:ribulose-5-phosphate 4-epimerase/fuculose-1-phosphate aldolase